MVICLFVCVQCHILSVGTSIGWLKALPQPSLGLAFSHNFITITLHLWLGIMLVSMVHHALLQDHSGVHQVRVPQLLTVLVLEMTLVTQLTLVSLSDTLLSLLLFPLLLLMQARVAAADHENQYLDTVNKSGGGFLVCRSFFVWTPSALSTIADICKINKC